ncbi:MAG: acyl carrier protein [Desulfobacteraceae bacterium]|nr:acyl carrier protein [Desulfobacteraceae bacterium]
MMDLKPKLRAFVIDHFLFGEANGLKDDTLFIETGIIDSTGVMEIVQFLEKEFAIHVADKELIPENLNSINNLSEYLSRKMV